MRRLLSEFIGTAGFVSILSGGAAILARYGSDHALAPYQYAFILSCVSALFIVAAVYVPGDISAHFNPATTFAFALRGDMGWPMAIAYIIVQFAAAGTASLVARGLFGTGGRLAATVPPPGLEWKNASFIPLAVGAYIMAAGTAGGPFDGAAFNQARAFGPDLARGDRSTYGVYPLGSAIGTPVSVGIDAVLRGPASAREALAAEGTPLSDSSQSV